MSHRYFGPRLAVVVAVALFATLLVARAYMTSPGLALPVLSLATEDDRRASLVALQEAWANRPAEPTPEHARAEKDFINYTARFLDRSYRKEIGRDAAAFYKQTVSDFFKRYGSEDILAKS